MTSKKALLGYLVVFASTSQKTSVIAFQSTTTTSVSPSAPSQDCHIETSLYYTTDVATDWGDDEHLFRRQDDDDDVVQQPRTEEEQQGIDKYLEYLDRRYHRLHDGDDGPNGNNKKPAVFSALEWLGRKGGKPNNEVNIHHENHQEEEEDEDEEQATTLQQQEDALYVLGLAGLASQKLLRKHHIDAVPAQKASDDARQYQQMVSQIEELKKITAEGGDGTIIDVDAGMVVDDEKETFVEAEIARQHQQEETAFVAAFKEMMIVPLLHKYDVLTRAKNMFLYRQLKRLSQTTRSIFSALLQKGPVGIVRSILEIGGGMKNIAVTFTAMSTLCVLLKPLLLDQAMSASENSFPPVV